MEGGGHAMWTHSRNDTFSYAILESRSLIPFRARFIWNPWIPSKGSCFAWEAC